MKQMIKCVMNESVFIFQCCGESEEILFLSRQILQSNVGNSAKNLTPRKTKFDACNPAIEI